MHRLIAHFLLAEESGDGASKKKSSFVIGFFREAGFGRKEKESWGAKEIAKVMQQLQ